jgi:hypothetical protein
MTGLVQGQTADRHCPVGIPLDRNPMNFSYFIDEQRAATKNPSANIRSLWVSRIVARNLHRQGRAGAATYLRNYGQNTSTGEVVALATMAESEGCHGLALGFWAQAFELTTGHQPPENPRKHVVISPPDFPQVPRVNSI